MSERATEREDYNHNFSVGELIADALGEIAAMRRGASPDEYDSLDHIEKRLWGAIDRLRAASTEPRCAGCGSNDVRIWGTDYCSFACLDENTTASTDAPNEEPPGGRCTCGHTHDQHQFVNQPDYSSCMMDICKCARFLADAAPDRGGERRVRHRVLNAAERIKAKRELEQYEKGANKLDDLVRELADIHAGRLRAEPAHEGEHE